MLLHDVLTFKGLLLVTIILVIIEKWWSAKKRNRDQDALRKLEENPIIRTEIGKKGRKGQILKKMEQELIQLSLRNLEELEALVC